MIISNLALSLAALLSISVTYVHARFFGGNDSSQALIMSAKTFTYSSGL